MPVLKTILVLAVWLRPSKKGALKLGDPSDEKLRGRLKGILMKKLLALSAGCFTSASL